MAEPRRMILGRPSLQRRPGVNPRQFVDIQPTRQCNARLGAVV
jgi:hypothetical protein